MRAIASICSVVIFTIILVAANTMAISIRERVREIGILKAMGATPPEIQTIFVMEGFLLAVLGLAFVLLALTDPLALRAGAGERTAAVVVPVPAAARSDRDVPSCTTGRSWAAARCATFSHGVMPPTRATSTCRMDAAPCCT